MITFRDFTWGLGVICRGTIKEKLSFLYRMHVQPVLSEDGTDINNASSEQVAKVAEDDGDDSETEGYKEDCNSTDTKQSADSSSQMSKNLSYFLKYKKKRQYEQERKLPLMSQVFFTK